MLVLMRTRQCHAVRGTIEMLIKTESINTLIHTVAERIVTTAVFRKHPDGSVPTVRTIEELNDGSLKGWFMQPPHSPNLTGFALDVSSMRLFALLSSDHLMSKAPWEPKCGRLRHAKIKRNYTSDGSRKDCDNNSRGPARVNRLTREKRTGT